MNSDAVNPSSIFENPADTSGSSIRVVWQVPQFLTLRLDDAQF